MPDRFTDDELATIRQQLALANSRQQPSNITPIIIAVILIALGVLGAIVAIYNNDPNRDSTPIVATLLGFAATIIGLIINIIRTNQVSNNVQDLHLKVDGGLNQLLTALLNTTQDKAKAEGKAEAINEALIKVLPAVTEGPANEST